MFTDKAKNFLLNKKNKINQKDLNYSYEYFKNIDLKHFIHVEDPRQYGEYKILQEISYSCTGKCPYCMNKGLNYSVNELDVKEYIQFYQNIIDNGATIRELRITGGEPLQPNVIQRTKQLIEYAKNTPQIKKIQLNTNGYWDIPDFLLNDSRILIQFSLDGNKEKMIKNFGHKDIYERLIKNFDYCVSNTINFQFRCVIDYEEDINDLIPFCDKYKKLAIISWALPVGGAYNIHNKQSYINMILKSEKYNKYFQENNITAHMRMQVGNCDETLGYDYVNFMITPDGRIGSCAYLANTFMTNYNIYNYDIKHPSIFIKELRAIQKDKTCYFPDGFLKFWNSLTLNEKKLLEHYISIPHRASDMPSLKEYYNL